VEKMTVHAVRRTASRLPPRYHQSARLKATTVDRAADPSTEVVLRARDGRVPLGSPGELCCGGPQVIRIRNNPARPPRCSAPTDLPPETRYGREGLRGIVDRKKDMLLVSGFNVYPTKSSGRGMHPGVLEARYRGPDNTRAKCQLS